MKTKINMKKIIKMWNDLYMQIDDSTIKPYRILIEKHHIVACVRVDKSFAKSDMLGALCSNSSISKMIKPHIIPVENDIIELQYTITAEDGV